MPPCPTVEPTGMGQQLRRTIPAVAPVAAPAQRTGSGAVIGKIKHIRCAVCACVRKAKGFGALKVCAVLLARLRSGCCLFRQD